MSHKEVPVPIKNLNQSKGGQKILKKNTLFGGLLYRRYSGIEQILVFLFTFKIYVSFKF